MLIAAPGQLTIGRSALSEVDLTDTDDLIEVLQNRGWHVRRCMSGEPLLPTGVQQRYPTLPEKVIGFLETFESCVNANETVWFLTRKDYRRVQEETFRWNEQEMMGLEAAKGDPERQAEIREFWDHHFPFMFSVHSDYDYLAVQLNQGSFGYVVHGYAPFWEEPSLVSPTFSYFLVMFKEALLGKAKYPLSYFL